MDIFHEKFMVGSYYFQKGVVFREWQEAIVKNISEILFEIDRGLFIMESDMIFCISWEVLDHKILAFSSFTNADIVIETREIPKYIDITVIMMENLMAWYEIHKAP